MNPDIVRCPLEGHACPSSSELLFRVTETDFSGERGRFSEPEDLTGMGGGEGADFKERADICFLVMFLPISESQTSLPQGAPEMS